MALSVGDVQPVVQKVGILEGLLCYPEETLPAPLLDGNTFLQANFSWTITWLIS
jgi:hypothetical protein